MVSLIGAEKLRLRGYRQDLLLGAAIAATTLLGLLTARGMSAFGGLATSGHHGRAAAFVEGFAVFLVVSGAWAALYSTTKRRSVQVSSVLLK